MIPLITTHYVAWAVSLFLSHVCTPLKLFDGFRSAFYPPWDSKMSSNLFTWVTEGGDLGTADWSCLAGRCASLCLQAAHGGCAAGGSG